MRNVVSIAILSMIALMLIKDYWYIAVFALLGYIILRCSKKYIGNKAHHSLEQIDNMSGAEFEAYLHQLYKSLGYKVKSTPSSGDYGADLILYKNGIRSCVQAKRYRGNVGVAAVQEVVGSLAHYNAAQGIVVTNRYYTQNARKLAHENKIKLIDRGELSHMINLANKNHPQA